MIDEEKKDICILIVRNYYNYDNTISDGEIYDTYSTQINIMINMWDELNLTGNNNISKYKEEDVEITYKDSISSSNIIDNNSLLSMIFPRIDFYHWE